MGRVDEAEIRRLARAVSAQLTRVLPEGFQAQEEHGQILLVTPLGPELLLLGQNIEENLELDPSCEDVICHCLRHMLNELQDIVTVGLTVPWPLCSRAKPGEFADPYAEVRDEVIYFGYGREHPEAVVMSVSVH